jgi:hypothetical protein
VLVPLLSAVVLRSILYCQEPNTKVYRDRAAERRILHRGLGVGPGQKQSNTNNFDEYEESIEDMDSMGVASADLNFQSSGLLSAKRIMENMGWKQACVCHFLYRLCCFFFLHSITLVNDILGIRRIVRIFICSFCFMLILPKHLVSNILYYGKGLSNLNSY